MTLDDFARDILAPAMHALEAPKPLPPDMRLCDLEIGALDLIRALALTRNVMAEIKEVAPDLHRARVVRKSFKNCLRASALAHDTVGGFALVSWDMRGEVHSSYFTCVGPVSRSMLPAYVHDALNRHVTIDMVNDGLASRSVD